MNRLFKGNAAMVEQARTLYSLIRQHEGCTRQYLASQLSLPATTLSRALERLLAGGLIIETGLADSSGGRRPSLFSTNSQALNLLGLDLTGNIGRLVLTDLHLRIASSRLIPDWLGYGQADLAQLIAETCLLLIQEKQLPKAQVAGLGISLPDIPAGLPETIAAALDLPVFMTNEADAGLYAAIWAGLPAIPAAGELTIMELSAGQDIQLGLTRRGQPRRSFTAAGTIGQLIVPSPDKISGTGVPLVRLAAMPALVTRFQRLKDDHALEWPDFCLAVRTGKRKASQIMLEAALALAVAILNAGLVTGGQVMLPSGQAFIDLPEYEAAVCSLVSELSTKAGHPVQILINPFGPDIQAAGAAALVLERLIQAA